MKQPGPGMNPMALALFCLGVAGWLRLTYVHSRPGEWTGRLNLLLAVFCAGAVLAALWGATVGYLARRDRWLLAACVFTATLPFTVGAFFYFIGGYGRLNVALLIFCLGCVSGIIARRIGYPHVKDGEAPDIETPPELFPK